MFQAGSLLNGASVVEAWSWRRWWLRLNGRAWSVALEVLRAEEQSK